MASRYSTGEVVSFFTGEESTLEDIMMEGSDDELGFEDEMGIDEYNNLLEHGKLATIMHMQMIYLSQKIITGMHA